MKPPDRARGIRGQTVDASRVASGHRPGTSALQLGDSQKPQTRRADSQSAASDQRSRLLTLEDAAAYLAVSVWTVRDLVWKGRLPVVRFTRRLHFDRRDLDRLIDQAKESG